MNAGSSSQVVFVTTRMGNHAGPSGYDHLANAIEARTISVHRPRGLFARGIARALVPLAERSGSQWYDRNCAATELEVALRWYRRRDTIFHFLYGENCVRYLPALTRRSGRNRLVGSFHTPAWRMDEVVRQRRDLRWLDAVVVVSTSQLDYWADIVGTDRVGFVPHGIDTGYFVPDPDRPPTDPARARILTVGHHLRDFALLAEVARLTGEVCPEVEFAVVARPDRLGPLAGIANVKCYSGLSDAELRALYQHSEALLMPLRDATANNAVLEGMACGLPVIATDIQGVRDYVAPAGSRLCANEADAFVAVIDELCSGSLDLAAMGRASRARAQTLSWAAVGGMLEEFYKATLTS